MKTAAGSTTQAGRSSHSPTHSPTHSPRRPLTALQKAEVARQAQSTTIFIPQFRHLLNYREWVWREFREGGIFQKRLEMEKRRTPERFRAVARARHGFRQNNKSDVRLVASIPARDYFRARTVDKDFWKDRQNLRNYKRDNPEACVYV